MVRVVRLTSKRYDIYDVPTGKYIGDVSLADDGVFRWNPFLSIYATLDSNVLRSIADFIDSVDKPSNETTANHTD